MRTFRRAAQAALIALAAIACTAAPASATDPAAWYNNAFASGDVSDCIWPKAGVTSIPARYYDGAATPFNLVVGGSQQWPGCTGSPGSIRVNKIQQLTIAGTTTYVSRGGGVDGFANRPHVHFNAGAYLQRVPSLQSYTFRNNNGAGAPGCTFKVYTHPVSAPGEMYYKPNEPVGSGALWQNYANPGARFGTSYNYSLWNLINVSGGGLVQTALRPRTAIYACDVAHLVLPSYWQGSSGTNGNTEWAYVQIPNGVENVWGWVMIAYTYNGSTVALYDWT